MPVTLSTFRRVAALAALGLAGACAPAASEQPALSDELSRDLDMASAAGVALAPTAGATQIVSAIERVPDARAVTPTSAPRRVATRKPRPAPEQAIAPVEAAEEPVVEAPAPMQQVEPEPEPIPVEPTMPRPTQNQRRQAPPGGWKTPSEVIRNAPFPINP